MNIKQLKETLNKLPEKYNNFEVYVGNPKSDIKNNCEIEVLFNLKSVLVCQSPDETIILSDKIIEENKKIVEVRRYINIEDIKDKKEG